MSDTNVLTKVLIIDDDYAMIDLLKILLESHNFEVYINNSGSSSAEMVREIDLDVVIVDLLMPVKDGLQVCRKIRAFSQVPILILSVVDKPEIIKCALDAGADEYLLKPVPTNVLAARLNTLVRRARAEKMAAASDSGKKNGQKHPMKTTRI